MTDLTGSPRTVSITQVDAATLQLDRAANLFLNERDYVSSITLACASEGITGEYLQERRIKPHIAVLKEVLQSKYAPDLSHKELNDRYLNRARNFFKHKVCDEHEQVEFDLQTEAITALIRAIGNLALLTESLTEQAKEFLRWLKLNRPDLTDNPEIERELGL